jgi:hexosaminidase
MKDNQDLQAYFNRRIQKIVTAHGKKMEGWDEILHPDLPKDIVIHSWRGQKSLAQAVDQGYGGLLSAGYYLDLNYPASTHYAADPMEKESANLGNAEKARILGGEACMWTEYVSPENIDSRIWPRSAAIAERFWSPQQIKDTPSMYRRLEIVSADLERLGLTHRSSYRVMLDRLVNGAGIGPIKTLADVVEPVKGYKRGSARKYTSFTPLNRLVDAARPESDAARKFGVLVDRFLASHSESDANEITLWLTRWRDNDAKLKPLIAASSLLTEIAPLSAHLSAVGAAGLDAMQARKGADRKASQLATLKSAEASQAEVLLMIVPAVRKLVEAAN